MTVQTLKNILRSKRFFYFILALFIIEAGWLAISGHYPGAFDEAFILELSNFTPTTSVRFGVVSRLAPMLLEL